MGLSTDWVNPTLGLGNCRQTESRLLTAVQYLSTDCQTCCLYLTYPCIRCLSTAPSGAPFLLLLCISCTSNSKFFCSIQLSLKTLIFIFSSQLSTPVKISQIWAEHQRIGNFDSSNWLRHYSCLCTHAQWDQVSHSSYKRVPLSSTNRNWICSNEHNWLSHINLLTNIIMENDLQFELD